VDSALQLAKSEGPGSVSFYDPVIPRESGARISFREAIERALAENEFELHFQPVVNLASGLPLYVEALIRWRDPERGLVQPMEFIPLAEATGRIRAISNWVLHRACATYAQWETAGKALPLSINIDAEYFQSPQLIMDVDQLVRQYCIPRDALQFEITETVLMKHTERSTGTIEALRELGVSIAIDDFGTGYSSLSYLRHLPVQVIKIDRSFIAGLDQGERDISIVRSVTAMAEAFQCHTVAEGVETQSQLDTLRSLGVEMAQGFLFSHPLPERELHAYLQTATMPQI
jgi:EAL domain-containing protein (putative c-di-GMP-specific phosphodiesterase class I)